MKSFRENPEGEANQKATRDNELATLTAKMEARHLGATGWEADNLQCRHVYDDGSTVCTICGE